MRKALLILSAFVIIHSAADAQLWKLRRYELTAGLSTTSFFGDIGGYPDGENILGLKDISIHNTSLCINTAIRYRVMEDVSVKFNLASGYFRSSDEHGSNTERGYESSTMFFEPAITGEYYFIKNRREKSYQLMKGRVTSFKSIFSMLDFYLFTGVGGLSYNVKPNAALEDEATRTTGFTAVIPAGLGINLIYSGAYNFGIELGGRYSFSDYIDGYSPDESNSNDVYYLLNFNFTYKIKPGKSPF